MKHLWIIGMCALATTLSFGQARASELTDEEKDIEAEEMAAEVDGSQRDANYLNGQLDQQRLDTEMTTAKAEKYIREANAQRTAAETQISRAETELRQLRVAQQKALIDQEQARKQRAVAVRKLAATIKQIKAYRTQVKLAQLKRDREEMALRSVKARLARAKQMGQKRNVARAPVRTASATASPAAIVNR